jgi:hypothetical protein
MMYRNNFVAVIKCNGRILRERTGGKVYLPYGSQYSVLLKNKDARRALVDIEIDGEDVLNGHSLIVGGNEEQEIKGFMRNMNKTNRFKFIKKTKEIQNYRGDRIDDGLVRITYRFEKQYQAPEQPVIIYNTLPTGTGVRDWTGTDFSYSSCTYSLGAKSKSCNDTVMYCCNNAFPASDEGITVKGTKINQNYNYGSIGNLESSTNTIVLHLLGITKSKKKVVKPITTKTKIRCTTCGNRNKSSNNFCYKCGTYLY